MLLSFLSCIKWCRVRVYVFSLVIWEDSIPEELLEFIWKECRFLAYASCSQHPPCSFILMQKRRKTALCDKCKSSMQLGGWECAELGSWRAKHTVHSIIISFVTLQFSTLASLLERRRRCITMHDNASKWHQFQWDGNSLLSLVCATQFGHKISHRSAYVIFG